MGEPARGEWNLLDVVEDFGLALSTLPPNPYAALVVAEDFDEIGRDDLRRVCTQLALSGCNLVDFHGARSELAEDLFDECGVILGVALDGDAELGLSFADDWAGPIEESPAARWKTYAAFVSISTTGSGNEHAEGAIADSLAGSIEMMLLWTSTPFEHIIALPLDTASGVALREALRVAGLAGPASP